MPDHFHALVISCARCHQGVEAVIPGSEATAEGFYGYTPFAEAHRSFAGHWPDTTNHRMVHGHGIRAERRG